MAITTTPYGTFLLGLAQQQHNLLTDAHQVVLLTSGYTPDFENDTVYENITSDEIADDSGTTDGYVVGGAQLADKAINYDAASKTLTLTADTIGWNALTGVVRYAVIYRYSNVTTHDLVGCIDFGADRTYAAAPFQLAFTDGVVKITS